MPKRIAVKNKPTKQPKPVAKVEPTTKPVPKTRPRLGGLKTWVWLAVVVLVLFEALINNNQVTGGQHLAELQRQQTQLAAEVSGLERQVASTGSLQAIRQRATEQLGLQEVNKNVLYVAWPTPVVEDTADAAKEGP